MSDAEIHRRFSAEFFNATWGLLDRTERTADDDERMISLSHASLAHWRLRPDCTARHFAIGYWQLSRVYSVVRQPENARHYGLLSLAASEREPPFFVASAHEALARAAKLARDSATFSRHLAAARQLAERITDVDERKMLVDDLDQLEAS